MSAPTRQRANRADRLDRLDHLDRLDRLQGVLLGTALGDALGLPWEGMSARRIARAVHRGTSLSAFRLLGPLARWRFGRRGFVSDDTEQTALVATALARGRGDLQATVRALRRSLAGWLLRLPWGIGLSTLKACLRLVVGLRRSGVRSAGNGAAMRAAVIGVHLASDAAKRRETGRALAEVTHTDPRGVEGALFVSEVAAGCANQGAPAGPQLITAALEVVDDPLLRAALDRAIALAADPSVDTARAAAELGISGYVVESVAFATFCLLRADDGIVPAITRCISAGGDTDTNAAILGAWLGARLGASALPSDLVARLCGGPFGPRHLRALARSLNEETPPPRFSAIAALLRNLALYPVVLLHGLRRLLP